jgi:TetR/AcrR family transcriptional repressor of nem operon
VKQRKKQPERTRQELLAAAGSEFSRNGYAGSGLGPIVAAAGLTKGALFHYFPDKRALALAWIGESLTAAIEAGWITPLASVASIDGLRALCRSQCMDLRPGDATSALVSLCSEIGANDSMLAEALEAACEGWRTAIAVLLERGKADGWIHRSIQPSVEAAFMVAVFSGIAVTIQCSSDARIQRTCATALEGYLETLRPQ